MKRKVKITKAPTYKTGGVNGLTMPWRNALPDKMSEEDISVRKTLQPVPWEEANLEAEKGEVAMVPTNSGIPNTFVFGGKRHSNGGTPANLPAQSFIYSDTKDMKIKDPEILKQFGMTVGKAATPAAIAKKYDINEFKKTLLDKNADKLAISTAERMIQNYNSKLGKLALVQESKKGFPQGIPEVAMPYLEKMGINPEDMIQMPGMREDETSSSDMVAKYGGSPKRRVLVHLPKAQNGKEVKNSKKKMTAEDNLNLIVDRFSNPKIQQALYDQTLAAVKNPKNRGKDIGFTEEDLLKMTPQDLANQFIEMQTRNIKTYEILHKSGIDYSCFNNNTGKLNPTSACKDSPYKSLDDVFAATGVGSPKDNKAKGIQQASYIGYRDLLDASRSGNLKDDELNTALSPFKITQAGVRDESDVDPEKDISKIDTYYTNTTAGQIAGVQDIEEEPEVKTTNTPEEETVDTYDPGVKADHLNVPPDPDFPAPWWLQDVIKTAHAAGDFARVKKYHPWEATANVVTPDVTFYDPNRELAANAEMANIAANSMAQFTGPQAFNARFAETQGNAARNAADVLSRYNNLNVGVSNQQANQNAAIMNQAAQMDAARKTGLHNNYQTVNDKFDQIKSHARSALVNQYANAVTNRAYTANLNEMYPQYAVDPSSGGFMYFKDPRALKPDFTKQKSAPESFTEAYNYILSHNPALKAHPDKVADLASKMIGISPDQNPYLEHNPYQGVAPGYVPGYKG